MGCGIKISPCKNLNRALRCSIVYDFIVVGAGPAGSSAAERLAKKGARVLMLERKKEIGSPVQCGEGISMYELGRIGMRDGEHVVRTVDDVELVFSTGSLFFRQKMASIDRRAFDRTLAERAASEGALLRTRENVCKIKRSEGGWTIYSEKEEYHSRYLIGADGYSSVVGQYLNPGMHTDLIVGTSTRGKKNDEEGIFRFHFSEKYPHGYAYVFSREGKYVNAGVVLKGGNISVAHRRFIKDNDITSLEVRGGAIPFLTWFKRHYGWRSMLVGDAAGLVNSISYGGIYAAVMSGKIAARAGINAMETGLDFPREYEANLKKSDFLQKNPEKEHEMVYSMGKEEMEILGELAGDRYMDDIDIFVSLLKLLRRAHIGMLLRLFRLYLYFRRRADII